MHRLLGTWSGEGFGQYPPNVPPFEYIETLTISPGDRAGLFEISSSTKHKQTDKPMHKEKGYIRLVSGSKHKIEFMICHAFGVVEITEGNLIGDDRIGHAEDTVLQNSVVRLEVIAKPENFARTSTAKPPFVTELRRYYEVRSVEGEDYLEFMCEMATTTSAMQTHLVAKLKKVGRG
jgi:hypothetical protein